MNLANRITLVRIAMIPCYLALKAWGTPGMDIVATIVFIVAALSDTLDGYIARSRGQVTNFGKFMDPIADKLLVMMALVLLVAQQRANVWAVLLILARELIISGFRLVAASDGRVIAAAMLGKIKTVTQLAAVALLTLGVPVLQEIVLWIAVVFTLWSGWDYLVKNAYVLKEAKKP
ncbi:MAG: CDP-diacylglycerol--glycerol-3-phosphate 3-phosphatidyltransferase [Clostridia bacterium]